MENINNSKLLFISGDEKVGGEEELRLLIQAIFETPKLDTLEERIVCHLLDKGKEFCSQDEIIKEVKIYLLKQQESLNSYNEVQQNQLINALNSVTKHEITVERNRTTYSPSQKLNPNAVFWPNPTYQANPRSIYNELPYAQKFNFLNKQTPVGSAGSCFAMEIADRLKTEGYNYVVTEPNPYSCAAWGTLFNAPSFRQLIEKAFGLRQLPRLLYSVKHFDKTLYYDPFREEISFDSVEEFEVDYERHIERAREALLKVKVFIITLGMNEILYLKSDGSILSRFPWRLGSSLVNRKVLTVEENIAELQNMLDIWRSYNPDLKLIISVSPVPLHATFRAENHHVITANSHSKSVLRVAAEEFISRNSDVYYFPSYETVLYCTKNAWEKDQRHVSQEAISNVMKLFNVMFLEESSDESDAPFKMSSESSQEQLIQNSLFSNEASQSTNVSISQLLERVLLSWLESVNEEEDKTANLKKHINTFLEGYQSFEATSKTPFGAYLSLRELYCLTNGEFNDFISNVLGIYYPEYSLRQVKGLLGKLDDRAMDEVVQSLQKDGFYQFEYKLSKQHCEELKNFALTNPCRPNSLDAESDVRTLYDRQSALATLYYFDEKVLINNPLIQTLVADQSLLGIAQAYLGCKPICDSVALWWSTPNSHTDADKAKAAQLYHFDMDRIKFLKFFIYLTDVSPQTGPHCYIKGSHQRKPAPLLRDGRIADDELACYYTQNSFMELLGEAGTIIAVDTRGFHKGKPLDKDERLILEIEFSNSLFGTTYSNHQLTEPLELEFRQAIQNYKHTYSRFALMNSPSQNHS
ncbi:MAG: GSCFA domain-containing protein [Oculatellaceae cyanobacterium bins.114]|nr:GSCFA domain-containing protein [Oculatellaceae cyanobacterium bins.114]